MARERNVMSVMNEKESGRNRGLNTRAKVPHKAVTADAPVDRRSTRNATDPIIPMTITDILSVVIECPRNEVKNHPQAK